MKHSNVLLMVIDLGSTMYESGTIVHVRVCVCEREKERGGRKEEKDEMGFSREMRDGA